MKKKERKKKFKSVGNENREKNGYSVKSVDAYAYNGHNIKVKCTAFQNLYH